MNDNKTKYKIFGWVGWTKYSYDFNFEVIGVFFVQKNKKFLFSPCIFPSEPFVMWRQKNKIHFLFVKSPLYVLIYEEQITFALKESGLIQEQTKNEKGKEKLHE